MTSTNEALSPIFDTRKYARGLTRGGVSEQQADAHAGALHDALGGVATKADIAVLRADMDVLRVEVASVVREMQALRQEMQALRQEMQTSRQEMQTSLQETHQGMQALRQETHQGMQSLRQETHQETQSLRQFMMMVMMAGFGWMTLMMGLMTIVFKFL